MTTQPETRDELVGTALAGLPVPEHGPGFDDELRERLDTAGHRRRLLRWPFAVAGGLVAAAAAVLLAVVALGTSTEAASAADVRRAVERALGSIERLSGVVAVREASGETRWRVTLDAEGNFRAETVGHPVVFAYSADDHIERISDAGLFTARLGVAPGPPDSQSSAWMLQRGLGSVVRALSAVGEVEELSYRGRAAWLLRTRTQNAGERREITVDREHGVPVRDVLFRNGRRSSEWRLDGLRVDDGATADEDLFRPERRPDQELSRWDHGFLRAPLESLRAEVGYAPLVPAWLPAGYRLADSAFARSSRPTGNEQRQNPPSRGVVSLAYRRGLDQIVITTRRSGPDPGLWSDPVAMGDLSRAPEQFIPRHGWLAWTKAEVVVEPNAPPHLWGLARGLVVTVTGDVDRAALIDIAHSLRPSPS